MGGVPKCEVSSAEKRSFGGPRDQGWPRWMLLFLHGLRSMFKKWHQCVRHCASCGRSWGFWDWLCSDCERLWVVKIQRKERRIHKNIRHCYLIDWHPGDRQLSSLVYSLKGAGSYSVFFKYSPCWGAIMGSGPLFYPSRGPADHASDMARALAKSNLRPVQPLLQLGTAKQSRLSRRGRQQRAFSPLVSKYQDVDFVDDIVTSGQTALAAWRALGQPTKMTVWSLFYRKSLSL